MILLLKTFLNISATLCLVLVLTGCEILPFAPIAVSGAGGGIAYTVTNVAYKTFSYPMKDVEAALHKALKKMDHCCPINS